MKKNVPSDHLEEFLQNAFEGYTESPSEAVWERIAADAKATPTPRFKFYLPYPVWIAIAVALLAGYIIYQSIYLNRELQHINRSVEEQQVEIQELQEQNQSQQPQETLPQASLENIQTENLKNTTEGLNENITSSEQLTEMHGYYNTYTSKNKRSHLLNNNSNPNNVNIYVENRANPPVSQLPSETIYLHSSIPTVDAPSPEALSSAVVNENANHLLEINRLESQVNNIQFTPIKEDITIPPALALQIQPSLEKTGFYVGISALPMKNRSHISRIENRPMPPRDRKEFNQHPVNKGNSLALGMHIGTKIGKQISLESGLLYRSGSVMATHEPKFKFKDRKFPPHGGGPRDSQFEYDLNTPTGTVALAITVESAAAAIPDDEEVLLEITAEQSLTYLSVPLLLNYQIGKGKLHLNAKGGVLTNFLLNNDFNITNINSNNINFKPQLNKSLQSTSLYFNNLSLDYLLQFGIAYDITRNMSVNISPTFIGSLSKQSSNRFIQSANYAAGVSAGMTWNF